MKQRLRFSIFFVIGLFLFLVYMGLFFVLTLEGIFPLMGIEDRGDNFATFTMAFLLSILSGSFLFSLFFVKPILNFILQIRQMATGSYAVDEFEEKLFNRQGKLKKSYWLYQELAKDIYTLADILEKAKKQQEELEQAKQDWVRGVSHDIKTPLSYITGYSALLLGHSGGWSPEETNGQLQIIYDKSKEVESLLNDLNLSFQMNEGTDVMPYQPGPVKIVDLAQRLVAELMNSPRGDKADISFETELETDLSIEADEKLISRALTNLMTNALTHNPVGTRIEITMGRFEGNEIYIKVKDNGKGIPENELITLLEKYHPGNTGDRPYGTGLGITVANDIVRLHGGRLEVQSTEGLGTEFTIFLES